MAWAEWVCDVFFSFQADFAHDFRFYQDHDFWPVSGIKFVRFLLQAMIEKMVFESSHQSREIDT